MYINGEIELLKEKFDKVESESVVMRNSDENEFLCFRLDGIKSSKRYLKDSLVNKKYGCSLSNAIYSTYYLYRNQTHPDNKNFFYCAFFASDEVSFILNKGCNYYDNRIFKIGTILAGTLSSAMTINFELTKASVEKSKKNKKKKEPPSILAFDSRPLVLKTDEAVKEYIRYRWLIACRNAACKVLRLESSLTDDELYGTTLKNDFVALMQKIEEFELFDSYKMIIDTFSLYVPNTERKFKKFKVEDSSNIDDMFFHLDEFLITECNGSVA